MAPLEETGDSLPYASVDELLERARGCCARGVPKEGIIVRSQEPVCSQAAQGPLSMKVINNDYLLREK